jgi:hypothetical protein
VLTRATAILIIRTLGEEECMIYADCAWNLGLKDESLRMFEEAARLEPEDGRIKSNYEFVKSVLENKG